MVNLLNNLKGVTFLERMRKLDKIGIYKKNYFSLAFHQPYFHITVNNFACSKNICIYVGISHTIHIRRSYILAPIYPAVYRNIVTSSPQENVVLRRLYMIIALPARERMVYKTVCIFVSR